jgi:hypothetical protein
MHAPNWDPTEGSGQVFLLDILSHRMSVMGIYQHLTDPLTSKKLLVHRNVSAITR